MNILDLRRLKEEPPTQSLEPDQGQGGKFKEYFFEIVKIVVISLVIIIPIRFYVIQPFIVEGDSMTPNFHDGEYLIVDEISYRFKAPERGQVVIFHPPQSPATYYIKRIIGLPGETVELKDGKIYIYNQDFPQGKSLDEAVYLTNSAVNELTKITLQDDQYYLIGDNRNNSLDSRRLGPINLKNIKGKAWLRAFPFSNFTIFNQPFQALK